jgi:hypothetical protein
MKDGLDRLRIDIPHDMWLACARYQRRKLEYELAIRAYEEYKERAKELKEGSK